VNHTGDLTAQDGAEGFRALVLKFRGRTGLSQAALARRAGVHLRSVQGWEGGLSYPSSAHVRPLIAALREAGGFTPGQESSEAQELWTAVRRDAPHFDTPFDAAWFAELPTLDAGGEAVADGGLVASNGSGGQHWGEAPDLASFLGRAAELDVLRGWLLEERCRVVAILGLGGIGKTLLATRLARDVAPAFDYVYWRSLRNAPALGEWLAGAMRFLSPGDPVELASDAARLDQLLDVAQSVRCLIVLDNFETLLQPGERAGRFHAGYEGFGTLLQNLAQSSHRSCLLLTSREEPVELGELKGDATPVRAMILSGLGIGDAQAVLSDKQLAGDAEAWSALVARYGGNGLALRMVGETIHALFGGDIAAFLEARTGVWGGIRSLLERQLARLDDLEHEIVRWLAIEREPVSFAALAADLGPGVDNTTTLEAVDGLRRRSMLERAGRGPSLSLQSVVLEYLTEQLVEDIAHELDSGELVRLLSQPLLKAATRDYVRAGQERLIASPILERLMGDQGGKIPAEQRLLLLLDGLREQPFARQGYAPGNVANLLRLLRGDLRGVDLSNLSIRQAYLQEVEAQDSSLASAELAESVLAESFGVPGCVALNADGAYLAIGTAAGEVCVWRVADRRLLLAEHGHTGQVAGVALSGDGRLLASGGLDGRVRLWDVVSGIPAATLDEPDGHVYGVALTRDGRVLAVGGQDGKVKLWKTHELGAPPLAELTGHEGPAYGVAMCDDGRLVVCGSYDSSVSCWDAQTGEVLSAPRRQTSTPAGRAVAVSGNGRFVASGGIDGVVTVWDRSGQLVANLYGHAGAVYSTALSSDGRVLASGSQDGTIKLWDVAGRHLVSTLRGHTGAVWAVAVTPDGQTVASAGLDGTLRLWEVTSGQLLATTQGHSGVVYGVALGADGRVLASGGQDGIVRLWDTTNNRLRTTLQRHTGVVYAVALARNGGLVASGGQDETVYVWDPRRSQPLAKLLGHTGVVYGVALSADGRVLVSGSQDETARLWDTSSGRGLASLQGHAGGVWGVALSEDGNVVATGCLDGSVRLWAAPDGRLVSTLGEHPGGVWGVALSADGSLVAGGGFDGNVLLWEADSGRMLRSFHGHTGAVWGVGLSADGKLLASGGQDGTARLWDTTTGQPLNSLYAPSGLGYGLALSGDGAMVASGSFDGTVKIWDTTASDDWRTLQGDRRYERVNIAGLTGITEAQRAALLAMGAVDSSPEVEPPPESAAHRPQMA
jgi:WD40 repeat protein